ncbi:tyrosine-protein phosphatase [Microbacterium rhizomatis]|uniref:Tyrosine-protein phosphatase n=1 Tax=Microbacterium rhizomatis TaxID=1631477 RepID=A0A5J5J9K7_9MICO|nr:tyrosine-protein phosphatase [Microbacterium rhizomatis]KAA9111488.1 tyrosine-protein phosphatase [Microbacterium rhizomatis]
MTTRRLDGTFNFRDVGGLPLKGGGTTRSGILYRSDALGNLTARGVEQLAASDIGVVVDFRTPMERRLAPDRLPTSRPLQSVVLPLLEGTFNDTAQQAANDALEGRANAALPSDAVADTMAQLPTLGEVYVRMLEHGASSFAGAARLVAAVSAGRRSAVLVHCSAGKDRTGVATAILLDAIGVTRDAVVADYAASEKRLAGTWSEGVYGQLRQMGVPLTAHVKDLISTTPPRPRSRRRSHGSKITRAGRRSICAQAG